MGKADVLHAIDYQDYVQVAKQAKIDVCTVSSMPELAKVGRRTVARQRLSSLPTYLPTYCTYLPTSLL